MRLRSAGAVFPSEGDHREGPCRPLENTSPSLERLTSIPRSGSYPNGKLKSLYAVINGKPELRPEGVYFLRYAKDGKRVWQAVGSDPQIALDAKRKKERVLAAITAGATVIECDSAQETSPEIEEASTAGHGTLLSEAVKEYVTEVSLQKAPATYVAYEHTLRLFSESCKSRQHLEHERKDLLAFMAILKAAGKEARTVANHMSFLKIFFRRYAIAWPLLKTDKVKYTQKAISAYSKDELRKLLEVSDKDEADLIHFFIGTGALDLEVVYATWPDVSFTEKSFSISEKNDAELKWKPKDGEEGVIPIPDSLVELLKRRRLRYPKTQLIFPTENGGPNLHMLRIVKRLALRAKLNCGHCTNKKGQHCDKHAVCGRFGLHKFRKTFASMHHEAGVSVRTIQRWLRHSDLETTLALYRSGQVLLPIAAFLLYFKPLAADPVPVRRTQGTFHGFLVLKTPEGRTPRRRRPRSGCTRGSRHVAPHFSFS